MDELAVELLQQYIEEYWFLNINNFMMESSSIVAISRKIIICSTEILAKLPDQKSAESWKRSLIQEISLRNL